MHKKHKRLHGLSKLNAENVKVSFLIHSEKLVQTKTLRFLFAFLGYFCVTALLFALHFFCCMS